MALKDEISELIKEEIQSLSVLIDQKFKEFEKKIEDIQLKEGPTGGMN